ncbi:biopolymer transporter ExbD [Phenylobacterium sp.]|jgi:biopolymer transport protein ExbD|uniref:biopolymer transporter ExbD n=1 Tax=Phenylobacterium sp. TaxID=1871053 RepID=UPI002ED8A5FE
MAASLSATSNSPWNIRQNADINVTPFVDVMLVLLIIFMVALPVSTVSVNVDLPQSNASAAPSQPVIVTLTLDGRVYVGDRATTLDGLPAAAAAALGSSDRKQRIYLRADEGVRYGALMGLMNTLRRAGYGNLGLVGEEF